MVAIIDDDTNDKDEDDGVQFKYLPLYLEWAPMAVFHADKDQEERAEGPSTGEAADGTEVTDASTRTEGTGKTTKVCMLVVDCAFWLIASIPPSPPTPQPPPPPPKKIKLHAKFKRVFILLPHPPNYMKDLKEQECTDGNDSEL